MLTFCRTIVESAELDIRRSAMSFWVTEVALHSRTICPGIAWPRLHTSGL